MTDQPGCPCSICNCDEKRESSVPKNKNKSDLRDRLLDTIIDHWPETWHGTTVQQLQAYTLTDAVIEGLGLRKETTYAWNKNRVMPTGTRYVTKWMI